MSDTARIIIMVAPSLCAHNVTCALDDYGIVELIFSSRPNDYCYATVQLLPMIIVMQSSVVCVSNALAVEIRNALWRRGIMRWAGEYNDSLF